MNTIVSELTRSDTPETITDLLKTSGLTVTLTDKTDRDKQHKGASDVDTDTGSDYRCKSIDDNSSTEEILEQDSRGRSMERTHSDDLLFDTRSLMGFGGITSGNKLHLLLARREDSRNTRLHRAMLQRSKVP